MADIVWTTLPSDILQRKSLYLLQISLKTVPRGSRHKPAMVQIILVPKRSDAII